MTTSGPSKPSLSELTSIGDTHKRAEALLSRYIEMLEEGKDTSQAFSHLVRATALEQLNDPDAKTTVAKHQYKIDKFDPLVQELDEIQLAAKKLYSSMQRGDRKSEEDSLQKNEIPPLKNPRPIEERERFFDDPKRVAEHEKTVEQYRAMNIAEEKITDAHVRSVNAEKRRTGQENIKTLFAEYEDFVFSGHFYEASQLEHTLVKAATKEHLEKRASGSFEHSLFEALYDEKKAVAQHNSTIPPQAKGEALARDQEKAAAKGKTLPRKISFPFTALLKQIECALDEHAMHKEVAGTREEARQAREKFDSNWQDMVDHNAAPRPSEATEEPDVEPINSGRRTKHRATARASDTPTRPDARYEDGKRGLNPRERARYEDHVARSEITGGDIAVDGKGVDGENPALQKGAAI